jgi:hypothetical protein
MATSVLDALLSVSTTARLPTLPHERDAVSAVKQLGRDGVAWLVDPGDPEQTAWFIAPSPARALQWILEHGTKKGVMDYVRHTRKRPRTSSERGGDADAAGAERRRAPNSTVDGPPEGEEGQDEEEEGVEDADGPPPAKRQKTTTTGTCLEGWGSRNATGQAMRKEEARRLEAYHRFFHNSQEAEEDVQAKTALCREQHAWLRFVGQQAEARYAGERQVADLVCRATTVGNSEAVQDLLLALQHWRTPPRLLARRARGQRHVLAADDAFLALSQQTMVPSSSSSSSSGTELVARDGVSDIAPLCHSYARTKGAARSSAFFHIDRRYHAARVREIYEHRCAREADPNADPALSTQKRGWIQKQLYYDYLHGAEAARQDADAGAVAAAAVSGERDWEEFRRTLKYGKRWLALERDFTCGIFALLPKSRIPSTFLERKLTDNLFALWCRMLRHCSPHAVAMAKDAEHVVAMMARDEPPPSWCLALESEEGCFEVSDKPTPGLAALLKREGSTSPRIREISSEPAPSISPPTSRSRMRGRHPRRLHYPLDDQVCVRDTEGEEEEEEEEVEATGAAEELNRDKEAYEEAEADVDEFVQEGDEEVFKAYSASIPSVAA